MSTNENPIDKDKTTDIPGLLPYAHHVGSAIIRPIDRGKEKGLALKAMYQQTNQQLNQIKDQVELLINQAQKIHDRIDLSEKIYKAEIGFKPIIGNVYYLYEKDQEEWIVSMIGPNEWGKNKPYIYKATIELLGDKTWDIKDKSDEFSFD